MRMAADDTLNSAEILPVTCPQCGESQNSVDGILGASLDTASVGCMVCGYQFSSDEYRELLAERQREFISLQLGDM